ncbi:hypothetical protein ACVGVM_28850 (plasmid) [Pseudonocardia bannensis]|uniref:Lipoprotein n=1 Tax=Pseudonocardia bannensis TaxID=630973 RepID=A0A848DQ02_9PSEU|nr:hypothetical protein [Pseudonocardia bannensis]NMH94471.1 hypothetical protein [Pseudonocardia bannensis]
MERSLTHAHVAATEGVLAAAVLVAGCGGATAPAPVTVTADCWLAARLQR